MSANSGGLAYRLALRTFGSGLSMSNLIVTLVDVAPKTTQVLLNNPNRASWLIINRSPWTVEIGFSQTWTFGQGIPLSPNGGQVSMQADEDGENVTNPLWMQTQVTGAVMVVQEEFQP